MSEHDVHLQLLHREPVPIPADAPGLTPSERELLARCGFWLEALAGGALAPLTEAQERFVAVAQGRATPVSEHEKAWVKFRPAPAAPLSAPPAAAPASESSQAEEVLRKLRAMLARQEITSGFADSVLRQWEESRRVTPKQLAAVRRLLARVERRAAVPRVVTGGSRKPGSHRSNW
jgi:hypothetical protein